ncbi:12373_t:CDS:2 [Gigaspora margarita]|uniref:12373_t:CDS:1 n=1 Tax=Gigaspora margarita TaxID=4874 RepID=A0ABN7W6L4_GIGMA|nr:12373_t:CDS:2 [Gigaspora margarita]
MKWFNCSSAVKITISQLNNNIATLSLKHKLIYEQPKDITISQDIKEFIRENIDLLLQEIYAQLVGSGLNLLIGKNKSIFGEQSQPIYALAIITELHDYLLKIKINIHECGIDTTSECGYDLVETESVNIEANVLYSNIEDNLNENSDELYNELMTLTTKALNLLEEQKAVGNS